MTTQQGIKDADMLEADFLPLQSEDNHESAVKKVLQDEEPQAKASEDTDSSRSFPAEPEAAHGEDFRCFSSLCALHKAKLREEAKAV